MATIKFIYQQEAIVIEANENDLFKDVAEQFAQRANVDLKKVYFYGGAEIIQPNVVIKDLMKLSNEISILVQIYDDDEEEAQTVLVDSKEVICPECKEPCRFQIENYKIKLSNCKNGHLI